MSEGSSTVPAPAAMEEVQVDAGHPFVERMLLQRGGQLREHFGVPAGVQSGVVAVQHDRKTIQIEGFPHPVRPRRVDQLERCAPP